MNEDSVALLHGSMSRQVESSNQHRNQSFLPVPYSSHCVIMAAVIPASSMPDIDSFFSAAGPLARTVPGYSVRSQQLEMAQAIAETIVANSVLVAEAGTGTGKTFAYLVPGIAGGRQGDHFHWHQDLARPAFQSRHSYRANSTEGAGHCGAIKGKSQLRLSLSS